MPRSETWWAQAMEDRRVAADAAVRRLFPPNVVRALVDRKLRPWLYQQHLKNQGAWCHRPPRSVKRSDDQVRFPNE